MIPLHSVWKGRRNGQPIQLTVVGIWATGGGENYQPLSYELQPTGSDEIIEISRETMLELINKKSLIYERLRTR